MILKLYRLRKLCSGIPRNINKLSLNCFGLLLTLPAVVYAQTGDFVPERFGVPQQEFNEEALEPPQEKPGFILPPLPAPASSDQRLSSQPSFFVQTIKLSGHTVFSDDELRPLIQQYENRRLTLNELQVLRKALTLHYINAGYVNSGALIPDQTLDEGVLEVTIIEGHLTEITVEGNPWLRDHYIQKRLWLDNRDALNINTLQQRLLLLQQDPLIDRLNAELVPGLRRGESVLKLSVEETRPYEFGVSFNNQRSTSIGELRSEVYAAAHNLTGFGDALTLRYGVTEGLDDVSAHYSFPLSARDTRLSVYYSRSDSTVVEGPFDQIGSIDSESESYGINLSHPIYRTVRSQLTASIALDRRRSETFLNGESHAFISGPNTTESQKGESKVTVLRLIQEWVNRSPQQVIALRSTFSFGLDLFEATDQNEPDGKFFSWSAQAQYIKRLWDTDQQLILRGNLQLSPDRLLPLEKFAVGGMGTVRGYRENLLVRDNAVTATVEFRLPLFRLPLPYLSQSRQDGMVQLAPFFDFGWSDNNHGPVTAQSTTLASIGVGLRWDPHSKIHSQLYWGYALRAIDNNAEQGLQDDGIHFLLDMQFL